MVTLQKNARTQDTLNLRGSLKLTLKKSGTSWNICEEKRGKHRLTICTRSSVANVKFKRYEASTLKIRPIAVPAFQDSRMTLMYITVINTNALGDTYLYLSINFSLCAVGSVIANFPAIWWAFNFARTAANKKI